MGHQMSAKQLRAAQHRRDEYRAFRASIGLDPASYEDAMARPEAAYWAKACEREYQSLIDHDVWELVPPPKTNVTGSRWVFKVKHGGLYKARFVAKGYSQQWGVDYDETFAPVAKYASIRTLISIAAARRLKIHQMDVKTAYLYGKLPQSETVYIQQPKGFVNRRFPNHVLRLRRSIYGLKQAGRVWYEVIAPALEEFEFTRCESDHSIFVLERDGRTTYIALYVDDLLIIGEDDSDVAYIKERLAAKFDMTDLGVAERYTGMEIQYNDDGSIKIHQGDYLRALLKKHGMEDCNPLATPLDPAIKLTKTNPDVDTLVDAKEYASIVGGIMYAACVTRPDIMCAVSQLSAYNANPCSRHLMAAKRVLRYLSGTLDLGITYRPPPTEPEVFSDANWAGDEDTRRSTTGCIVMLNGGGIIWMSRRQVTVALSTMESEYMALAEAAKEIKWLRLFLSELRYGSSSKSTTLNTDNQGALALAKNPVSHARSKHIDIRHHFIRDTIADKSVWLQYIPTEDMTADSLTKALGRQKHYRCLTLMGMEV
jgi:Reverse transcriptase (RNA-dependent DNA polymerase)